MMTAYRQNKISELTAKMSSTGTPVNITLLSGAFGIGKSEFLETLIENLQKEQFADAICYFDYHFDKTFLVDFLASFEFIFSDSDSTDIVYDFIECIYNRKHLRELLDIIEEKDSELYTTLLPEFLMRNFPDEKKTDSEKNYDEKLSKFLDKKGDRRFLTHHSRVIAESLLVDFMNFFYPLDKDFPAYSSYLANLKSPVKILIIQDNIDTVTHSVVEWLNNELLPMFLHGKFGDFISYDIDDELKDVEISKFFDFRFLISSRIDLLKIPQYDFLQKNKDNIASIVLEPMTKEETKDYLAEKQVDAAHLETMYSYSLGLPFIIDLLLDYNADEINDVVCDSIYEIFTDKVLDGRTPELAEAIKMSAFINSFDETYLRCNRKLAHKQNQIFEQLKFLNDLYMLKRNELSLREPFKKILSLSLERNFKSDVLEYKNITSIYRKVKFKFPGLTAEELNILRSLAYFEHFDLDMAIDLAFDDKAEAAGKFVQEHKQLFTKNKHTLSIKKDDKPILDAFNKILDRDKYLLKKQFIENIWDKRKKQLNDELEEEKTKLTALNEKLAVYGDDPTKVRQKYDLHQKAFIEKENDLINLRKKLETYSYNKYIFSLIVNVTAAVMSFIIADFFPELFSTPKNHSSILIFQYVLFFLSCVFLIIGFNFAFKLFKAIRNKKAVEKIQQQIADLEDEKRADKEKMRELKSVFSDWQKNVNEINEQKRIVNEKIKEIKEILAENYI